MSYFFHIFKNFLEPELLDLTFTGLTSQTIFKAFFVAGILLLCDLGVSMRQNCYTNWKPTYVPLHLK